MKIRIVVSGGNGQLGHELAQLQASFPELELHVFSKSELDITASDSILQTLQTVKPHVFINSAAYTAVDKAESEKELAHLVNVTGVENVAKACLQANCKLIHISTDYVYHGFNQIEPFVESDLTNPQSVYARTKLEGELAAQKICNQTIIVRTSWVYSNHGHNFVKTMLRLGRERDSLNVVADQIGSPTNAKDLAIALLEICKTFHPHTAAANALKGIYHYSNEGQTNWADFAREIFKLKGLSCKVNPIPTSDYPTPAMRPLYSLLDKTKIKKTFNLVIPNWTESLAKCLKIL